MRATMRSDKTPGEIQADSRQRHLCGLLMSAVRYVEAHAENENNHPQSREHAASLVAQINIAVGR